MVGGCRTCSAVPAGPEVNMEKKTGLVNYSSLIPLIYIGLTMLYTFQMINHLR